MSVRTSLVFVLADTIKLSECLLIQNLELISRQAVCAPSIRHQWCRNRWFSLQVQWTGDPGLLRATSYNRSYMRDKMSEILHLHSAHTIFHTRGGHLRTMKTSPRPHWGTYSAPQAPCWCGGEGARCPFPETPSPFSSFSYFLVPHSYLLLFPPSFLPFGESSRLPWFFFLFSVFRFHKLLVLMH